MQTAHGIEPVRPAPHDNVRHSENGGDQLSLWDSSIPSAANRRLKSCCSCTNESAALTIELASGDPVRVCRDCASRIAGTRSPWVYFLRTSHRVKIGTTKSFSARLETLQNSSPRPLTLWHLIEGGYDVERQLHAEFAEDRLHGEWFRVSPQIEWFVEGRIREHYERTFAQWEARWGSGVAA